MFNYASMKMFTVVVLFYASNGSIACLMPLIYLVHWFILSLFASFSILHLH